ncbi:MAG TPA: F0F1 ATP synthase subunit delta [Chloroflexota bacterium]|nr:F0F1 ATP synthase subunit delta [Chloroflexota bacterium]
MPASASARRYAAAAFNVAAQNGDYDVWLSILTDLARIMQMPSARTIFASPAVATSQKVTALDRIAPTAPPLVRNFLHILAERDRLDTIPGIAEALQELINAQRGIITADVTTAIPLDADMQRLVAQRLGAYFSRDPDKVEIRGHVDPNIIGGVVARVGDRLIDDSIRGRLERLRRTLAAGTR